MTTILLNIAITMIQALNNNNNITNKTNNKYNNDNLFYTPPQDDPDDLNLDLTLKKLVIKFEWLKND
jgi:hypothetical protein